MNNPFEHIQDIKERKLAFLENTAQHYNSSNRSASRLTDSLFTSCTYYPIHSDTEGCAIGRWLERDNPIIVHKLNGSVKNNSIISYFPVWMREMGISFLSEVQKMHDGEGNWSENGLSDDGKVRFEEIKKLI